MPMFPPVVYVPCAPAQDTDELTIDLRATGDGLLALLVYSAMDRLIEHCGAAQPWTVLLTSDLDRVRSATGFALVLLDVDIPEELRRTEEER
ncbi:SAV_915 family protein [Actinoplanes sp. HUAS TT8]|uniref:SAV_915 family protein n=1 Tax=Actinoplanes sp. HUAS TT8 TaxID=3447453 RepID=UPI003F51FAFC